MAKSWEVAEQVLGCRVDRRKSYVVYDSSIYGPSTVFENSKCTLACSGCTEVPEMTRGPDRGDGCHECGYTGKRVQNFGMPIERSPSFQGPVNEND